MSRMMLATLLAISSLLSVAPVTAQTTTRDQIRMIEQEYASQSDGQMIPDNQLEYYLDRANAGWTMSQISQDMANSQRQDATSPWRPQTGWVAREVVCTSDKSQYRECAAPFRGRAVITQQISQSACIEGQSWGQKPGVIWVNRGCRARFGIVPESTSDNPGNRRMIVCQSNKGRYRECATGFRDRVQLVKRLNNSAACIEGRTWGQREGRVWVSRGCRAQFASIGRPGPRDDGPWNRNYAVTCASTGSAQVRCAWDDRYGEPRLDQQLSQNACIEGRNWDYDDHHTIWVSGGCRARFVSSRTGFADRNDDRDDRWERNNDYAVTCSSDGGRMTRCAWDERYGSPRLVQQLSGDECVQGSSWGYDDRDGLWVDDGCRARFEAR